MNHHWSRHHHETATSEDDTERDRVESGSASADESGGAAQYESVFENPERVGTAEYIDVELARINPPV